MSESAVAQFMPLWFGAWSAWTFILFGLDKWLAGRDGGRIAEATLCWCSAVGGWPGGLFGLLLFRHKSAKTSFQLKFAAAFVAWVALVAGALRLAGKW
jgi:uncharacterized membrane protein YsdA (DUF1294 family)